MFSIQNNAKFEKILNMKKTFFGVILLVILLSSCRKYSDGPSFSLLSKKSRICNDWLLVTHTVNDEDVISQNVTSKMIIEKDGTYAISETTESMGQLQGEYSNGNWSFSDAKDMLYLYQNGAAKPTRTFKIKELRNKEIKLVEEFTSIDIVHTYLYIQD